MDNGRVQGKDTEVRHNKRVKFQVGKKFDIDVSETEVIKSFHLNSRIKYFMAHSIAITRLFSIINTTDWTVLLNSFDSFKWSYLSVLSKTSNNNDRVLSMKHTIE